MSDDKSLVERLRARADYHAAGRWPAKKTADGQAAAAIERLTRERDEARDENTRLRAAIANGSGACVYCSLPADKWVECKSGFPGCARADDALGCAELGARLELAEARAAQASARNDALEEAAKWHDARHAQNASFCGLYIPIDIGGMHARFAAAIRAMKREPADD